MTHPESDTAAALSLDRLKQMAIAVADALKAVPSADAVPIANTGGGSRHRGLPEDLRQRFIAVRAALFTRGIYDPVLVRFDTATVAQAPTSEIAEALATVAAAL
jgi:hypothetical protein